MDSMGSSVTPAPPTVLPPCAELTGADLSGICPEVDHQIQVGTCPSV